MNLTYHPLARQEIMAIAVWHNEARPGLGDEFLIELERTLDCIKETPALFPLVYKDQRRAQLKRFRYGVFLEIHEASICIYAVYDLRRSVRTLHARLRQP